MNKLKNRNKTRVILFLTFAVSISLMLVLVFAGAIQIKYTELRSLYNYSDNLSEFQSIESREIKSELELLLTYEDKEYVTNTNEVELIITSNRLINNPKEQSFLLQKLSSDKTFVYLLTLKNLPKGFSTQTLDLSGGSGNSKKIKIRVNRSLNSPNSIPSFEDVNIVLNGNDITAVVNKESRLYQSFEPSDLVAVNALGIPASKGITLRSFLIPDLRAMINQMQSEGLDIMVSSGYRSYSTQVITYNYWLQYNQGNYAAADSVSARPGHSEHQLGTTIDLVNSETNHQLSKTFATTKAGDWLMKNAYKYGFALSYPPEQTDYTYEPWHWRYIGKTNALTWFEQGKPPLSQFLQNINTQ